MIVPAYTAIPTFVYTTTFESDSMSREGHPYIAECRFVTPVTRTAIELTCSIDLQCSIKLYLLTDLVEQFWTYFLSFLKSIEPYILLLQLIGSLSEVFSVYRSPE